MYFFIFSLKLGILLSKFYSLIRLAHIINPVKAREGVDLFKTQAITFKSIAQAKAFTSSNIQVSIFATCFENEVEIVPDYFTLLSFLEHNIRDIFKGNNFPQLPFIDEIFNKVKEVDADYIIYTNADIALMPYFYEAVAFYISKGHDAISVNRRRLTYTHMSELSLPILYSDIGLSHPGFDCFIFKKELLNNFVLGKLCLGIPFVEVALLHNMAAFSSNPLYLTKEHLTFHIGAEVMPSRNKILYTYNRNLFFKTIYPVLKPMLSLQKLPYYALPMHKRALKWLLNPSLFTFNYLRLERLNVFKKMKYLMDEIRWRMLER